MYKNSHSESQAKYKKSRKGRLAEKKYLSSEAKKEAAKRYRLRNASKIRARKLLQYAFKMGRIEKLPCEACGSEESQAHHEDYSKPMDVKWFCNLHHSHVHHGWL